MYEAPPSPPGGIKPRVIKKPDHDAESGGISTGTAVAIGVGGVAVGALGAMVSMEYMEK